MKKLFKKLNQENRYFTPKESQTQNFDLQNLWSALCIWGNKNLSWFYDYNSLNWEWLQLNKLKDENKVFLWDTSSIKSQAKKEGLSKMEQDAFDAAYEAYYDKRWDDVPKLFMTIENYVEIVQKWQRIVLQERPNYIILSQDDTGYVDLVGKDELSEQDVADMQHEHQKFLKYKAAYDKYSDSRPDIVDELWHGPESSEYEADWQKFLEEPLD